ncbi:uncharacterized protein LOC123416490 [Hordeum vulgare subsp. vulgare]|uniref:uncharacterized protein LOC123416490 n=1 Tax=Hordeum vulgare subsp. vulgare TaxID=112509 RepID=UPI001D1A5A1E|nr:uncharacterized protein LOC123416490 [Hordeum vulgare subsp. vulgare]
MARTSSPTSSSPRRVERELKVAACMCMAPAPPRPMAPAYCVGMAPAHADILRTYESHALDSARTGAPSHRPSFLPPPPPPCPFSCFIPTLFSSARARGSQWVRGREGDGWISAMDG